MKPLLSIVIANYNYGRFLEEAIRSVVTQGGFDQCELIVVDGGSSDNSVEVIKKYADKIAWWCSEPDKGQSNAFNKGFAKASGKYLTWLNADDILVKGCLNKILSQMKKHPECEWFTGNFFRFVEGDGRVIVIGWGPHWYPRFLQRKDSPLVVFGPTTFFSKNIYEKVGRIDEDFHYTMDTDLWIRFIMAGVKQRRINCFCWEFRMHEGSKTAEFGDHVLDQERANALQTEKRLSYSRSGYRPSRLMRVLCQLFRLLDGSAFRRIWLQKRFKTYFVH